MTDYELFAASLRQMKPMRDWMDRVRRDDDPTLRKTGRTHRAIVEAAPNSFFVCLDVADFRLIVAGLGRPDVEPKSPAWVAHLGYIGTSRAVCVDHAVFLTDQEAFDVGRHNMRVLLPLQRNLT